LPSISPCRLAALLLVLLDEVDQARAADADVEAVDVLGICEM
jgi:hypothetical protein